MSPLDSNIFFQVEDMAVAVPKVWVQVLELVSVSALLTFHALPRPP